MVLKLEVERSNLSGEVCVPASKSNTIRAIAIAAFAAGVSEIVRPLDSADTRSCMDAYGALGAQFETDGDVLRVRGVENEPQTPTEPIDVGNSGTTLYFILGSAALADGPVTVTGDEQIRRRSAGPLIRSLNDLGANVVAEGDGDCAPIVVRGRLKGGETTIECPTSQYLSSLLLSCPLAPEDSVINVVGINERPYVEMTLNWLNRQDVQYAREGMDRFEVSGGHVYDPHRETISADFSSAAFFFGAAAVTGSELVLDGLDMNDCQGDKAMVFMLRELGCEVEVRPGAIRIGGGQLHGGEFDLNATPDLLPIMSIVACFADSETRLVNVPQARIKETDRIRVMRETIQSLGGDAEELPDGLIVRPGPLTGGTVDGHGDHRVVMAAAVGGLASDRPTEITTAESVAVTFPSFVELMERVGARMRMAD